MFLWSQSADLVLTEAPGLETDSHIRGGISEHDFHFPLRQTGVEESPHVYGCLHPYAACCGFVCANTHTRVSLHLLFHYSTLITISILIIFTHLIFRFIYFNSFV